MSSSNEPMTVPSDAKVNEIRNMTKIAGIIAPQLTGAKPKKKDMIRTIIPCMVAAVAVPAVRPIMTSVRDIGATSVSFRNPNWRSQITSNPEKMAVNMILIPTMPGAR